jgi:DNA-binding NarL/FixJ family response regulator
MRNSEKNSKELKNDVVIITDHSPLTENLIEWLNNIYPQILLFNGDQDTKSFSFLKIIKPELIIIDPGFTHRKESELMEILKTELVSTKLIILSFYESKKYRNFMENTGIKGAIIKWKNYTELPFLMHSMLKHHSLSKPAFFVK